jgi:hypothetical protein
MHVAGSLIASVEVAKATAHLRLRVRSPAPGCCNVENIFIDLRFEAMAKQWSIRIEDLEWCQKPDAITGPLNDWLSQTSGKGFSLKVFNASGDGYSGFPLHQLGVAASGATGAGRRSVIPVGWASSAAAASSRIPSCCSSQWARLPSRNSRLSRD